MKFLLALSISFAAAGAIAAGPAIRFYGHRYSARVFNPAKCADHLKTSAAVSGPYIRGDLVAKIKKAFAVKLPTQFADLQNQGIFFGHEDLVSGDDGDFVNFKSPSFASLQKFFLSVRLLEIAPDDVADALEASIMYEIGAVVYGQSAKNLFDIYSDHAMARNVEIPPVTVKNDGGVLTRVVTLGKVDFTFFEQPKAGAPRGSNQTETMVIADLRATPFTDLIRFVDVIDGSTFDPVLHNVRSWGFKARGFLAAAKQRDPALSRPTLAIGSPSIGATAFGKGLGSGSGWAPMRTIKNRTFVFTYEPLGNDPSAVGSKDNEYTITLDDYVTLLMNEFFGDND